MFEQYNLTRIGEAVGYALEEGDIISVGAYYDSVRDVKSWWVYADGGLSRKIHNGRQLFQVYKVTGK